MRRIACVGLSLPLIGLLAVGVTLCSERIHTVRAGESASSIAKDYYGAFEPGVLLLEYNDKPDTNLQVGERLRIPYSELRVVRPGDSWSRLAQAHLGRASAYPALIALNGLPPEAPLRVGASVVMPIVLPHRLERGESLSLLAERYHGDPEISHLLQLVNGIEDPRTLSVGQMLRIPLVSLRLREDLRAAAGPDPPAKEPVAAEPPPPPPPAEPEPESEPTAAPEPAHDFRGEILAASNVYDNGDFARARRLLETLRPRVAEHGSESDLTGVLRLLAYVYIAFDLPGEACAAFRSIPGPPAGAADLDPDGVSPKIRGTLAGCAG